MFLLGITIMAACVSIFARYDPKDMLNAQMLFIMENSFLKYLRLVSALELGRMMVLYATCLALTRWL